MFGSLRYGGRPTRGAFAPNHGSGTSTPSRASPKAEKLPLGSCPIGWMGSAPSNLSPPNENAPATVAVPKAANTGTRPSGVFSVSGSRA
ncbi:MAG TPA: hypothetical protein PKY30_00845 [Myxococcota bacterium]|nr:hypothetical protein [Myxococcota bacterium]